MGRKAKKVILSEFCANAGYHRKYAIRLLNGPRPKNNGRGESGGAGDLHLTDAGGSDRGVGSNWLSSVGAAKSAVAAVAAVDPQTFPPAT